MIKIFDENFELQIFYEKIFKLEIEYEKFTSQYFWRKTIDFSI